MDFLNEQEKIVDKTAFFHKQVIIDQVSQIKGISIYFHQY